MLHLLPIEILRIIAGNIIPAKLVGDEEEEAEEYEHEPENRMRFVCQRVSIAPLSVTSHHLRHAIAPLLFEKVVFKNSHVFSKALKDVDRVKRALTSYPNVVGYVRHVYLDVSTWGTGEEINHGSADFASCVLDSLPSLHTVRLVANELVSFDDLLLRSIHRHKTLLQVIIQDLESVERVPIWQTLSPNMNGKMVIDSVSFYGNGESYDQLAQWERVLALGVHVNTLVVNGQYDGGSTGWSEISFTGLKCLDTHQAFPPEHLGEDFPGSFADFVRRHPNLTSVKFTRLDEEDLAEARAKHIWLSSPLMGPFFRAFDGSSWILRRVTFMRMHENQGYQCENVYLSLADDMEVEDLLSALHQSCTELQTLFVEIWCYNVNPGGFMNFALSTVRHMFGGGPQLKDGLSPTLCLQWCNVWDELIRQEIFTEELTIIMQNLTLEIANLFPSVVHVHHEIEPNLGLWSFFFTISRSPEGLVSVVTGGKSFARHEHLDIKRW